MKLNSLIDSGLQSAAIRPGSTIANRKRAKNYTSNKMAVEILLGSDILNPILIKLWNLIPKNNNNAATTNAPTDCNTSVAGNTSIGAANKK